MERLASISRCGKYRWALSRCWDRGKPWMTWIMLNPSTADGREDDPTIRRCIGFAAGWGFGGMVVINLFPFRATKPSDMLKAPDPQGPKSNAVILDAILEAGAGELVVVAWGAELLKVEKAADEMLGLLEERGIKPYCLGATILKGSPVHPLYQPKDLKPQPFIRRN